MAVRPGRQLYFFGGGAVSGGFGLTIVAGFFRDTASASNSLFAGGGTTSVSLTFLTFFVGGGIGSFAMAYVLSGCSGYSMNSTISTSLVGIRMATPSAGIHLSSSHHSPSAIRKWPSSGWLGHSSGQPKRRRYPFMCNTT